MRERRKSQHGPFLGGTMSGPTMEKKTAPPTPPVEEEGVLPGRKKAEEKSLSQRRIYPEKGGGDKVLFLLSPMKVLPTQGEGRKREWQWT